MRDAMTTGGLGARAAVFGAASMLALSACEIENGPPGPDSGGTPPPSGTAGASGTGNPRLPASIELRARLTDAGVQQTVAQNGSSVQRIYERQGVSQVITFEPAEAKRAMSTNMLELGLYTLSQYTIARPAPGACQVQADVSFTNGALTYRLGASEPATDSACSSFMSGTSLGTEIVYQNVPVVSYSASVETPPFVTVKVVLSPQ